MQMHSKLRPDDGGAWEQRPGAGASDSYAQFATDRTADSGGELDFGRYYRLLLKNRFVIIGCVLACFALGVVVTLLTTPTYTASTTIQIDRESARVLDGVNDVTPAEDMMQGMEFFETQYGLLRSRSLAERVIATLGLARSNAFLEDMGASPVDAEGKTASVAAAERREQVLETVQSNLTIAPVRTSRLVEVKFDSPNPALSARITNAFAEEFIRSNLERRFETTSYAREFLEGRLADTKQRLEDAERQLVAYATEQQIINVGAEASGQSVASQESLSSRSLSGLSSALTAAQAGRVAAEERWRATQSAGLMNIPEVLQNPAVQALRGERARISAEYEQKLSVFKPEYPEMRQLQARLDEIDGEMGRLAAGIRESVRSNYTVAANQERALQDRVDALKGDVLDLRDRSIQYNILQREVDTTRTLYDGLLQRYKEVGVSGAVTANNVSIVDPSNPPSDPSKPRVLLNLALSLVLGLGLGLAAAVLRELLDETLATPDDVEQKLGLKVLGVAPLLGKAETPLQALADMRSGYAEAYYSLRTALQFSTSHGAPASLLVTSSGPSEGKSSTAYAVAMNLARIGKRVLLVDGDLRNPSLYRMLGCDNGKGVTNVLSGGSSLQQVVTATKQDNLEFVPCGPLPPNPAELWNGPHLETLLAQAQTAYDHVVIDGPPVLGFADAPLLASAVEGTLFVLESRGVRRGQARGALSRLALGDVRLLGVVLTKFNAKSAKYGGYGYDYAYDYNYGVTTEPRAQS